MKSIILIIIGLILFNSVNALIRCYECIGENNNAKDPCSKCPPNIPKLDFNQCKDDHITCVRAVITIKGDTGEAPPPERQSKAMKSITIRTCGTPQFCKEPSRFMLEHINRGYPGIRADGISLKKCSTCSIDLCNRSNTAKKIPFIFYFIFLCIINLL